MFLTDSFNSLLSRVPNIKIQEKKGFDVIKYC